MSLAPTTQLRLAQTIQAVAQAERRTELSRQVLAQINLFESYTAFRRMDQLRSGELNLSTLIEFLDDNSVPYTQNEVSYLFKKLDNDRDGRINYQDFVKFVLPKGDVRLKQMAQLRESYFIDVNMLLPAEVEKGLSDLFREEIQNYKTLQASKDALVNSLDYNSLEAFRALDLFNIGYLSLDSLNVFMKQQGVPMTPDEQSSFFRAVDTDEDGRISYAELVEAVHLMEPLPYRPSVAVEALLRESQLQRVLERSRALERVYLPSYPYYMYPYYPLYYPSYYPWLTLTELRLRESSLERLRASRMLEGELRVSRIHAETELRLSRLQEERRSVERLREAERERSIERLRRIQEEAAQRQRKLDEEANQRRQQQVQREEELQKSRERIRQIEEDARLRQLQADRDSLIIQQERESRFRQLEAEKRLVESEVQLASLERINSLERLRRLEALRYPYYYPYYPYYPSSIYYDPIYVPRYVPMYSGLSSSIAPPLGTPQKQSPKNEENQKSGLKEEDTQEQQTQQPQPSDKLGQEQPGVRKSLNEAN